MESAFRVKFLGATDTQVAWGANDNPNKILRVGEEYDVVDVSVHSWHTKIMLEGFEEYWFNDASFEYLGKHPDRGLLYEDRLRRQNFH